MTLLYAAQPTTLLSDGQTSILKRQILEIDTSRHRPAEQSSISSLSESTMGSMGSDESMTSDTEEEDEPGIGSKLALVLKTEPEEAIQMEDIKISEGSESPQSTISATSPTAIIKRPRGRPKKPPTSPTSTQSKIVKGRSKTGCYTCRKRKKKCDETKPGCIACDKNNVICEGYPPKSEWKAGKQRSEEISKLSIARLPRGLPVLIDGIETPTDHHFFAHFVHDLSRILTLHDNQSNPFKDLLLPMAREHKGLMHSLMALSGSHVVAKFPTPEFMSRKQHHSDLAISILQEEITRAVVSGGDSGDGMIIEDPTVASTIVQCLICISDGSTRGEYRVHLQGAGDAVSKCRSKNPEFQKFIYEFFTYHEVSSSVTSLQRRGSIQFEDGFGQLPQFVFEPVMHPASSGVMVGVLDGLFRFITKITRLRDMIRERIALNLNPMVPYDRLQEALDIDAAIRAWETGQEEGTARWFAAELYRRSTWVYLYRTIKASKPSDKICAAVDDGLSYLRALPSDDSTQCILLLPLFILGCAAFHERQRPDIERAFDTLQTYSNLGNIPPARRIVKRVWEMMDAGDERSWDWETIMADMGIDVLVT